MTPAEKRALLLAAVLEERFPRAKILAEEFVEWVDPQAVRIAKAEQARREAELAPTLHRYSEAWRERHGSKGTRALRTAS